MLEINSTLTVVLNPGLSDEDAEKIADAIRLLDGVANVGFNLSEFEEWVRKSGVMRKRADRWFERVQALYHE